MALLYHYDINIIVPVPGAVQPPSVHHVQQRDHGCAQVHGPLGGGNTDQAPGGACHTGQQGQHGCTALLHHHRYRDTRGHRYRDTGLGTRGDTGIGTRGDTGIGTQWDTAMLTTFLQ